MTNSVSNGQLEHLQNEILEAIAGGETLKSVADLVCLRVEDLAPTVICSILTVDAQGFLHPLAGPSLPDHYSLLRSTRHAARTRFPAGHYRCGNV
jgi:GAF domain-containing protein